MEKRDLTSTESVSREELEEQERIELALEKEQLTERPMSAAGCLLRGIILTVLLTVVTCGGGYVGVQYWIAGYAAKRDAILATIRAKGEPITAAEMAEFAATPKEPNQVTARYLAILGDVKQKERWTPAHAVIPFVGTGGPVPRRGQPWPDEKAVKDYLSQVPWLDDVEAMAETNEEVRIPRDYGRDTEAFYDNVSLIRSLMRELMVRFHVRMRDGDRAGALRTLRALLMLPRAFEHEPDLGSQSVRMAYHMIAMQAVQEFLRDGQATSDEIATIRSWPNHDFLAALVPTLKGERATGMITLSSADMSQLAQAIGGDVGLPTIPSKTKMSDLRPGDTAVLIEKLTELIKIAEENDLQEVLRQFKLYEQQVKQMTEDEKTTLPWNRHVLVSKLLPPFLWTPSMLSRAAARQSALKAALDVEEKLLPLGLQGRTKEAEIAAIEAALPVDPFTGQPMKYVVEDSYYRIYSVGDNGLDDASGTLDLQLDFGVEVERTLQKSTK